MGRRVVFFWLRRAEWSGRDSAGRGRRLRLRRRKEGKAEETATNYRGNKVG